MDFTSVEDLDTVVKHIHDRYPQAPIYLVGFSMGAIMALRWLAEQKGKQTAVKGAVSISCPVDLSKASPYLSRPRNIVYSHNMTQGLIRVAKYHKDLLDERGITIGPLVDPGSGPCLRCVELDRRDADAASAALDQHLRGVLHRVLTT